MKSTEQLEKYTASINSRVKDKVEKLTDQISEVETVKEFFNTYLQDLPRNSNQQKTLLEVFIEGLQDTIKKFKNTQLLMLSTPKDLNIPENFIEGQAVSNGDCFFDAVAQRLRQLKPDQEITVKSDAEDIQISTIEWPSSLQNIINTCQNIKITTADKEYIKSTLSKVYISAAVKGNIPVVKFLILFLGPDAQCNENTPLWHVVDAYSLDKNDPNSIGLQEERIKVISYLIDHGANINASGKHWGSQGNMLHVIAKAGCEDIAKILLECDDVKVDVQDQKGYTPLHFAAEQGHSNMVELLLGQKADINSTTKDGDTPLHFAAKNGDINVVNLLLENNAKVDGTDAYNSPLWEVSHFCTTSSSRDDSSMELEANRIKVMYTLIKNGADVNACGKPHWIRIPKTEASNSILHNVAKAGHLDIVKMLIERGAYIDPIGPKGITPLHLAAKYGHLDILELLLNNNADINRKCQGSSPLQIAFNECVTSYNEDTKDTYRKIICSLIARDAVINFPTKDLTKDPDSDNYPISLDNAVRSGVLELVSMLIARGADVNDKGKKPTPLWNALYYLREIADNDSISDADKDSISEKYAKIAHILINSGADVNVLCNEHGTRTKKFGSTPLILAVQAGRIDIVENLIQHDANVKDEDNNDYSGSRTPLDYSKELKSNKITMLLRKHGADSSPEDENSDSDEERNTSIQESYDMLSDIASIGEVSI